MSDTLYDYPPFPGFDAAAFSFLNRLKRNNRREWLTPERKKEMEDHLIFPLRSLLADVGRRCVDAGLDFRVDPKRGIFRIYRDVRFSKDKKPFKTNIGGVLPYADEPKKGIGGYIHIEPGRCFFGAGGYFISGEELKNFRRAIEADPDRFRTILDNVESNFGEVHGERLKRAPAGYDVGHPAIDLLRYKNLWTSRQLSDDEMKSPDLSVRLLEHLRNLNELCEWLYSATKQGTPAG